MERSRATRHATRRAGFFRRAGAAGARWHAAGGVRHRRRRARRHRQDRGRPRRFRAAPFHAWRARVAAESRGSRRSSAQCEPRRPGEPAGGAAADLGAETPGLRRQRRQPVVARRTGQRRPRPRAAGAGARHQALAGHAAGRAKCNRRRRSTRAGGNALSAADHHRRFRHQHAVSARGGIGRALGYGMEHAADPAIERAKLEPDHAGRSRAGQIRSQLGRVEGSAQLRLRAEPPVAQPGQEPATRGGDRRRRFSFQRLSRGRRQPRLRRARVQLAPRRRCAGERAAGRARHGAETDARGTGRAYLRLPDRAADHPDPDRPRDQLASAPPVTRANRNLGILAIIAIALVVAVPWIGRREYLRDPPTLTPLDPDAVTQIELDIPAIASQVFERRADDWWRVQPSEARADDARVQRLANLAATSVARWIPSSAITLSKVGLAHPSATLVLDGVRLEYGGLTAIDGLRYVRVGDKVALVPRQYSPEVMLTKDGAQ